MTFGIYYTTSNNIMYFFLFLKKQKNNIVFFASLSLHVRNIGQIGQDFNTRRKPIFSLSPSPSLYLRIHLLMKEKICYYLIIILYSVRVACLRVSTCECVNECGTAEPTVDFLS